MAIRMTSLLGALVMAGASLPASASTGAASTLGEAAAATGRFFGVAVAGSRLGDAVYAGIVDREFGSVTPENELKFDATEPARNEFRFGSADKIVARARANGARVRGHSLVAHDMWHTAWIASMSGEAVRSAVTNHITNVVTHFKGQIDTWDVVNEAFLDDDRGTPRDSPLRRAAGERWIDDAFIAARAADPDATLCYNDYGVEDFAAAKTRAVFAMVKGLKSRGVPIDCVGLESHFVGHFSVPASFERTIGQFAALGVEVQLTQLDVSGSGQSQADAYTRVIKACLAVARCTGITVWGVRDRDSWRSPDTPLLFDNDGGKKPAYHAVLAALSQAPSAGSVRSRAPGTSVGGSDGSRHDRRVQRGQVL